MYSTSITLDLIASAVEVTALRHSVHSANIANADVPGFRRLEVLFQSPVGGGTATVAPLGANFRPVAVSTEVAVRLDQEMAVMAQNSVRYQMLMSALDYTLGSLRNAAREGRGS